MPAPLEMGLKPVVLHDEDGLPITALNPLPVAVALAPLASVAINDAGAGVTELSVKVNAVAITGGSALIGGEDPGGLQRAIAVDASGRILTSAGAVGTAVTSPADIVVGIGATVALPVPPVGTSRMVAQVTGGDATTRMRIRELAGAAGTGILLLLLGTRGFGGGDGAIASLEIENVVGPAGAAAIQFED